MICCFRSFFHAQLGSEDETFNLSDVISGIYRKLVHRHPHVFADTQIDTEQQLLENWERLKAEEKKGRQDTKGMLDGLSNQLPALSQSQGYQQRAARVGFDWPDVNGIFAKIAEELTEFKEAATSDERAAEMGDLLFATVRLADWYKIDAETALRAANQRFRTRFSYIEEQAKSQERPLTEMTLDEMNPSLGSCQAFGLRQ